MQIGRQSMTLQIVLYPKKGALEAEITILGVSYIFIISGISFLGATFKEFTRIVSVQTDNRLI